MPVQSVTLHLPEVAMQRARQSANVLQRPVEKVLTAVLVATLPDVRDVPWT